MSEVRITPDGYAVCPACGHHTSAYCGGCTVIIPEFDADGKPAGLGYCGCDCIVKLGGKSLFDTIAEILNGREADDN